MYRLTTVFRRLSSTASHDSLSNELSMTAYHDVVVRHVTKPSCTAHGGLVILPVVCSFADDKLGCSFITFLVHPSVVLAKWICSRGLSCSVFCAMWYFTLKHFHTYFLNLKNVCSAITRLCTYKTNIGLNIIILSMIFKSYYSNYVHFLLFVQHCILMCKMFSVNLKFHDSPRQHSRDIWLE